MAEEHVTNDRRTDRRSYLKKLVLGIVGAGALLGLRDVPKVSALPPPPAGAVPFANGAGGLLYDDPYLHWDDTGKMLGVGLNAPARSVHLQGGNACFRMDRNVNSAAFILVRTALGDFNTIWKTFYVGVDANGVNDGSLFIGDVGTNVAGPSTKRLVIANNGNVGIGTENPQARLHVAGDTATDGANIIMGQSGNWITPGVKGATISGGGQSTIENRVTDDFGTVGGGAMNRAGNDDATTTNATYATVGGGYYNTAVYGHCTVAGGYMNNASNDMCTVSGGGGNNATGPRSTVAGGYVNTASGSYSTVGGGWSNVAAGNFSFAAGRQAKINAAHDGTFLFADQNDLDFNSTAANQFRVRCTGGAMFVSGITAGGADLAGVSLAAGGNAWVSICDRSLKENFETVDGQDILESLSRIPITQWNLKSQPSSIRHMGPMAQDFYAAFGLGEDDRHISTVDMDGVALASIQALHRISQKLEQKAEELEGKTREIDELRARLEKLERIVKHELSPIAS